MELFWAGDIDGDFCRLDADESAHCVKVLRHREGDEISVIDGEGTLLTCRLADASFKSAGLTIISRQENWGSHPYHLTMAVCPTKNNDRYEWFAEKATEVGIDVIVPVIGEHSERKVFKTERLRKILLSATKQSLKGAIPQVREPQSVSSFIQEMAGRDDVLKLIAYCFEGEMPRHSVMSAIRESDCKEIAVLIGPEGDFSKAEADKAIAAGFTPIHLGASRLRTETAALTAVEAVYLSCI